MSKALIASALVVLAVVILLTSPVTEAQAPGTKTAQVWVTELVGSNVLSDGRGVYKDDQISGGDPCVRATTDTKWGSAMLDPYYPDCLTAQPRKLRYYLPEEIVTFVPCALTDPGPDEIYGTADDRKYAEDVKRIHSNTLFLDAALTDGADVRFGFYCPGSAFSIQLDANIRVQKVNETTRRLTNFGSGAMTASLYNAIDGGLVPHPSAPTHFPFYFDVTFESVPAKKPGRK